MEKGLLNFKEFCEYINVGKTKAREIISTPRNGFSFKIGSKWYVKKDLLDEWLYSECKRY